MRSFGLTAYEQSAEFTADWFNSVGVTVILVQMGDILFSHGNRVLMWMKFQRRKKLARNDPSSVLTQDALNKVHLGPNMEFHANYASLLSVTFVCLTFSTGMPILYFVASVNMMVYYYVEKYCFFNLYRTPPNFTGAMGKRASSLLPLALIIHLAMSVWVLSNPELFDTTIDSNARNNTSGSHVSSSIADKVTGKYTYPLFAFMIVLIAERIVVTLIKEFVGGIDTVAVVLFGKLMRHKKKDKQDENKVPITYSRAIARSRIKGLPTYNILQNPAYKDRFAITWAFAYDHKTVRAVRMNKTKAQARLDEDDAAAVAANQEKAIMKGRMVSAQRNTSGLANKSFYQSFYNAETSTRKNSPSKSSSRPLPGRAPSAGSTAQPAQEYEMIRRSGLQTHSNAPQQNVREGYKNR